MSLVVVGSHMLGAGGPPSCSCGDPQCCKGGPGGGCLSLALQVGFSPCLGEIMLTWEQKALGAREKHLFMRKRVLC